MRRLLVLAVVLAACQREPIRELERSAIIVEGAHMRTDRVGDETTGRDATFVLVDARNTAGEGAWVTLDGELLDRSGAHVADLLPTVLWIPAGEARTYALVDSERVPRPTAVSARARVRAAVLLPPPLAHLEEVRTFDDHGQLVLQAYLVNDADRAGLVNVTAAFHDDRGRPLTRPFQVRKLAAKQDPPVPGVCPDISSPKVATTSKCVVQLVGPPGATRGSIFVGEAAY